MERYVGYDEYGPHLTEDDLVLTYRKPGRYQYGWTGSSADEVADLLERIAADIRATASSNNGAGYVP